MVTEVFQVIPSARFSGRTRRPDPCRSWKWAAHRHCKSSE